MNVWYVHPYAGGPGIGRYWRPYYFSKFWNQTGHQSTVITASYHHLLEPDEKRLGTQSVNGAHYTYVPTLRYLGNGMGRMLSMLIFSLMLLPVCLIRAYKNGRPDAIIYSSPHPFGAISCWLAARFLRAKFVFEVRDIWPLSLIELGGLKASNPLVRITGWIERFAYARSDKVISLLPCAEAHMVGKGLAADKFIWIPNGVDSEDIRSHSNMCANNFVQHVANLKEKGVFVIIYAGAHGEPNALEGLVRSAKLLMKNAVSVRIILVGKGERKAQLKEIAANDASGLIDFFDQQPKEAVMAALRLASAGYISLKSEPIFRFGVSPNKLWDYMLVGLPIIFACKAGNDPVEEYRCGVSADPDSPADIAAAISKLVNLSQAELLEMGRRGHAAVLEHYTYERLANNVLCGLEDGRRT
ncbi:glycosyltransferase family 4 protein [Pseudomonas putida]|uniref:glycosyltransferase family 4 protein n=1 Tax=Pseudomonas TaxID=286 RepID=UPI001AF27278|nr:glycosyltransferase family 4 protein [Pseudomonas putida]MDD2016997.1 glycosyltransferase family 4 protein [Pseudomonas putida]QRI84579.1 glycosyltransferase family 4 protein [Pseudomonas putida]HDS1775026.1 glycosyltransferase family 4 protein [Pseudomonas putida]